MEGQEPRRISDILPNVLVVGEPLTIDDINPLYGYLLQRGAYRQFDLLDQETRAWGVARRLADRGLNLGGLERLWRGSLGTRDPERYFFRCVNRLRFGAD